MRKIQNERCERILKERMRDERFREKEVISLDRFIRKQRKMGTDLTRKRETGKCRKR